MGEAAKRVLQDALALPLNERRALAEQLFDALNGSDAAYDDAWKSELDARLAEMQVGVEEEVSLEEARRRLTALSGRGCGE